LLINYLNLIVIQEFIQKIEEEFENIKPGTLTPDSKLRENFEWDSVNALVFIAMVNVEYDVSLNAEDLQASDTVGDIFNLIVSRKQIA